MSHTISLIIAGGLMVPGIFMAIVPMLPALTYMFIVALAFGLYDKFVNISGNEILILLGITLVSVITDHVSGILGAKYGGAHAKSIFWGIVGTITGTFTIPGIGSLIGLFLGVLLAEIYYKRHEKALQAATGAIIGSAVGIAVNVILALVFTGLFIFFALS